MRCRPEAPALKETIMQNPANGTQAADQDDEQLYRVREAVAVFPTEQALIDAIETLEQAGFDRTEISVLAPESAAADSSLAKLYKDVRRLEDDGNVPRSAYHSPHSRAEGEAAAVALPVYIGGFGGLFAAVATGGLLAFTIPLVIAGGLTGGGLGAVCAYAIARRHRNSVERQMAEGGFLLWVRTRNGDQGARAKRALADAGGTDVHLHEVTIKWGTDEVPFADTQPDPLLIQLSDTD
jgi:hypothetical protein